MSDLAERAVRAATTVSWTPGLSTRYAARRIQDAALRVIDARVLQRLELIDREFDRTTAELERSGCAADSGTGARRVTPFPDMFAMFAAGFGAGLSVGAGRVVSRTPAGEIAVVGPTVLVLGIATLAFLVTGALFASREKSTSPNRALFLWFATGLSLIATAGVSVRLAVEEFTAYGLAAAVTMAVTCVVGAVLAIRATRRHQPDDDEETAPRLRPGTRERHEPRTVSENAQDRAHDELEALDESAHAAFDEAYAAGLAAAAEQPDASLRATARRLQSMEWAAARYDLAG
jgi:hypothetical protein